MHSGFEVLASNTGSIELGTQNDIGWLPPPTDPAAQFLPSRPPHSPQKTHIARVGLNTRIVSISDAPQETHQLCTGLPTGPYDGRCRFFLPSGGTDCAGGTDAHPLNHTIRHDRQRLPRLGREHQN